ncbi:MAG: ATP-binding protein [Polyangia bacterium]|jgi:signal transduction histidine kinase
MAKPPCETLANPQPLAEERDQTIAALRQSLRHTPILILAVDGGGAFLVVEGGEIGLWQGGRKPEVGLSMHALSEDLAELVYGFEHALVGESHTRRICVGGRVFEAYFAHIEATGELRVRACCLARDITEQANSAKRHVSEPVGFHEHGRRMSADLPSIIEGLPVGIVVTRSDRIIFCNAAAAQTLDWRDPTGYLGRRFSEFFPPGLRALLLVDPDVPLEVLQISQLQMETGAGKKLTAEVQSVGVEFEGAAATLFTIRDVSHIHQIEQDLRQAQRLEAIGQLAAGIAHEINTPIQFIGDNASFLVQAISDGTAYLKFCEAMLGMNASEQQQSAVAARRNELDISFIQEEAPKATANIMQGVARVAKIVSSIKAYAHPAGEKKALADLNHALETTVVVATSEWKRVGKVVTELGVIPLVLCHLGELNQVFLNLIVNAAHAIQAKGLDSCSGGLITIRSYVEGCEVVVAISDNGAGIPPEIRDRVFDPFFTTKEVGRGTGQGLTIARRVVVDQHGGRIDLTSEVGKGTTFFVRLPLRATESVTAD